MKRKRKSEAIQAGVILLALPALILPAGVLLYIGAKGVAAWDWRLLMTSGGETGFGAIQSLWPQIAGSLLLAAGATVMATPLALGLALYIVIQAPSKKRVFLLGLLHMLQGLPPIVYGLFGLVALAYTLHLGVSVLTGSLILAIIILPLLTLNTLNAIERISVHMTESARSLGLSDGAIVWRVWRPTAWPEIVTGLLLGMARALSETAPIIFTATVFSGVAWPDSFSSPVTSLQTHIFYLAQEGANPHATDVAWAAALILTGLVLLLSLGGRAFLRYGRLR